MRITKGNKKVIKPELHSNANAEKHVFGWRLSNIRPYLIIKRQLCNDQDQDIFVFSTAFTFVFCNNIFLNHICVVTFYVHYVPRWET